MHHQQRQRTDQGCAFHTLVALHPQARHARRGGLVADPPPAALRPAVSLDGVPPMPAVARILARFERNQLAGFIAVAIDLLDTLDGPEDAEQHGRCRQQAHLAHAAACHFSNAQGAGDQRLAPAQGRAYGCAKPLAEADRHAIKVTGDALGRSQHCFTARARGHEGQNSLGQGCCAAMSLSMKPVSTEEGTQPSEATRKSHGGGIGVGVVVCDDANASKIKFKNIFF